MRQSTEIRRIWHMRARNHSCLEYNRHLGVSVAR